jgi:hypothetical protein
MDELMKKEKIISIAPEAEHSSVYVFYNTKTKISLFVDAWGADEIYEIFDECAFENRSEWKILLELANQPSG